MNPYTIKEALETKPFEPFVIHTGDGEKVKVMSREFAFLRPGGRTLIVVEPKGKITDREEDYITHTIDVFLITKLISLPKKSGGKRRRKAS